MKPALAAAWLGLLGATALASPLPDVALQRFRFQDGAAGSLAVATGQQLGPGQVRVGLAGQYENAPLVMLVDGVRTAAAVEHRAGLLLDAAWAPSGFVQLALAVPLVLAQSGADLSAYGVQAPRGAGVGSPYVGARLTLLTEGEGGLVRAAAPIDLALALGVALPFGASGVGATEAGVLVAPELSVGKALGAFRVGGALGADLRTAAKAISPQGGTQDVVGHELKVGLLAAVKLGPVTAEASLRAAVPLGSTTPAGAELLLGARVPVGPVELVALLGPGLGHLPGTPAFRGLLGVAFPAPGPREASEAVSR